MAVWFLPGVRWVVFLVCCGDSLAAFSVPAAGFLDGLRAAFDLAGFGDLQREEERLDELLPWSGNV